MSPILSLRKLNFDFFDTYTLMSVPYTKNIIDSVTNGPIKYDDMKISQIFEIQNFARIFNLPDLTTEIQKYFTDKLDTNTPCEKTINQVLINGAHDPNIYSMAIKAVVAHKRHGYKWTRLHTSTQSYLKMVEGIPLQAWRDIDKYDAATLISSPIIFMQPHMSDLKI